ncbi:MAG: hypothetical protein WKF86_01260 [Acidimicrobiales bacterium]
MQFAVSLTGWYVGFAIAGVTISLVVVLAGIILGLARIIGRQAVDITEGLDQARLNTLALWDVDLVNRSIVGINRNAAKARSALEGQ